MKYIIILINFVNLQTADQEFIDIKVSVLRLFPISWRKNVRTEIVKEYGMRHSIIFLI